MFDLLLENIGLLATPQGCEAHAGVLQGQLHTVKNAMLGVKDGAIAYAGPADTGLRGENTLDCEGRLVTPGLVDCHTHLVFGGWRQQEMKLKLEGASYLDILAAGGGILNTVRQTRLASEDELVEKGKTLLAEMLAHGTTTCEAKSGYGLDVETELKQLRVIKRLGEAQPVELSPTFLGAHALPEEYRDDRDAYVKLVCDEMLPRVAAEKLAGYCDVFCETGVFTVAESRRILLRAKELGLGLRAHVDEIDPIGGAEMAAEMGCTTAEHLICASDAGIKAMVEKGVIAALLPATSFYLGKNYARAKDMVAAGVPVAVASDFNPGSSPSLNLQFPMQLACLKYGLTPSQALCAATLNAAAAIGLADKTGTLEEGKQADIVVWDAPDLEYIFYRYGSNLAAAAIKRGAVHKARV